MSLHLWDQNKYFKKRPPLKFINRYAKKRWDSATEALPANAAISENRNTIITMPSFGLHGRWGNTVFQYLFIRILALNNDCKIELYKDGEYLKTRMSLYTDMGDSAPLQTRATIFLLDSYQSFIRSLNYIPGNFWRAMYVSNVRLQKCYFIKDTALAINQPLPFAKGESIEVEGLFIVNPKMYRQKQDFIRTKLFKPTVQFNQLIEKCMRYLGLDKTLIGIHIRKGDFIFDPLQQSFQFPIPAKYIISWLTTNISKFKNPVIVVCSDDEQAYKEIEIAGFDVVNTKKMLPDIETTADIEQLDWEILRRCNVLIGSNSSFSFSAALLAINNLQCFRFSLDEKAFIEFNPWDAEPLQHVTSSPYLWSYLSSRFKFVLETVNKRQAGRRLYRDMRNWLGWKLTKPVCLYYVHGLSGKFWGGLLNLPEFFKLNHKGHKHYADYHNFDDISNL